ncbi:hypothetical protein [Bacillus sp. FSL K6-3431]|uniref:hypothetical protein n=1 Tax=Bacillus sp. FSL K6-3431 TaxID=2921500 RepID=UPI0030F869B7
MRKAVLYMFLIVFIVGCGKQIPEPEAAHAETMADSHMGSAELKVRHTVQGNNLFIECIIPGIFYDSKETVHDKVRIMLYVNGEEYAEYDTAAFIVKDLKPGIQDIKVEVVIKDNEQNRLYDKFSVIIS